jgi:hypothetical protein
MSRCRKLLPVLMAVASAACGGGRKGVARTPGDHVLTIVASDTHFEAPDTVLAGLTTIRLVTEGEEPHQAALLRISGGKTYTDFLLAIRQPGPPPAWVSVAGGVNAPKVGGTATVTMALDAGTYAILSFLPTRDGYPQLVKGLRRELTVSPSSGTDAAPAATDTLVATDYAYTNSAGIGAGVHTFLFENRGPQAHEVALFRLAPGHSAADMIAWIAAQKGSAPGEPLGGIYALPAGAHAWFTVSITPGDYAFICFLPDDHDGRPHHAHGQIREFSVK